jgi:hypothetical protein
LYEAAGRPDLASLVRQGERQPKPLGLHDSTISDWLAGTSVPSPTKQRQLRFLIEFLEGRVKQRGGHNPRGFDWWEGLRREAWQQTHVRRGGRPRTRPDGAGDPAASMLGRTIGDLSEADALLLEVHESISVVDADLPLLPPYLRRAHDEVLRGELARAEQGSRVVMLVGESSTGKTRACWEAIRQVLPRWRVWHPLTPERPYAVVEVLRAGGVGPRTVIWLNEAQMYLQPAGVGEQVATALQQLLHDPARPVLILGSMWPKYWAELTDPDFEDHAATRALLGLARAVSVPVEFDDLDQYGDQLDADPRLQTAVEYGGKQICQHLAGAPELLRRYDGADVYAKAVLYAAIDARRVSHWLYLPREFLHQAAPGYLTRQIWDQTPAGDAWFDKAMRYLTRPCAGVPGPLHTHRPLPGQHATRENAYRLADYLEQVGGGERAHFSLPGTFWDAILATCVDPGVLTDFAQAAEARGHLHAAIHLARHAADHGDVAALRYLAGLRMQVGDRDGVEAAVQEAADRGDAFPPFFLAFLRERNGEPADAEALRHLARARWQFGDRDGAEAAARTAAARGDTSVLEYVALLRDQDGAEALHQEAADRYDDALLSLTLPPAKRTAVSRADDFEH